MDTLLNNCTVIDGTGKAPAGKSHILIQNRRITDIGQGDNSPGDKADRIVDLSDCYVLPGFWSVHTHIGDIWPNPDPPGESIAERTVRSGHNAMDALRMGITSLRVVGEAGFIDVAWKRAFDAGVFIGPSIYACGYALITTGGHADFMAHTYEVDGPDEIRKATRVQLKHGADQIKLYTVGAEVLCERGLPGELQFTLEEIRASTEVAHDKGVRVCSHTGSAEGVKRAIRGGVDCIEHGYYLDDEAISMMLEKGIFYTPTLSVTHNEEYFERVNMSPEQSDKARAAAERHGDSFRRAYKAGVRITCGGDNNPIGWQALSEIELLVREGMTEMDALIAATRTGADLCGVLNDVGTVETGKIADLLVLEGNPLEDISNVWKTKMVIKSGNVVDLTVPEGQRDFWELFY